MPIGQQVRMTDYVTAGVHVQEQYALVLNRKAQGEKAERVLIDLIERRGPSNETYGILGRVYKDRWKNAVMANESRFLTAGLLNNAIDAYLSEFDAVDRKIRSATPGYWDYATLLELEVLADDMGCAAAALSSALAAGREPWMRKTTADNIAMIRVAREQRGAADPALGEIEEALRRA